MEYIVHRLFQIIIQRVFRRLSVYSRTKAQQTKDISRTQPLTHVRGRRLVGGGTSLRYQVGHSHPVRLAYQVPANSTFLSEQTSHQQPVISTFLSEQTSTSHQPPA
jgi:hypothetical protein